MLYCLAMLPHSEQSGDQASTPHQGTCAWQLADLTITGRWTGDELGQRWRATFASRPAAGDAAPDLSLALALADSVPSAPDRKPDFQQGDLLAYTLDGELVTAHFPRFGQLRLDLTAGHTQGVLAAAALSAHGVFEDLLAIGLSPHLRRRGLFLLHAFAASPPGGGPAVLLVGDIGAGKTTTGLALLHAGWRLLSNDSPLLRAAASGPGVDVLAYPGLLSAYPDTLARFPELAPLNTAPTDRQKVLFAAESVYPGVWAECAHAGAIVYPQIEARADHALEALPAPEALRLILPHAVEQWDRAMIPPHLALLTRLVQSAPAYRLRLAPTILDLADIIHTVLRRPLHS
jgi:hypothetical protein